MNYFRKPPPQHELNRQSLLWPAMSAYGSNGRHGSPPSARAHHDSIVRQDPKAHKSVRPLWAITHQGYDPVTATLAKEIVERTSAGYRVVFGNRDGNAAGISTDLDILDYYGALPECIGLGNEWETHNGKRVSPDEMGRRLHETALTMRNLGDRYGVLISPPAFSSFVNVSRGYGAAVREYYGSLDNVLLRVHNYRHLSPSLWGHYDVLNRTRQLCGLESDTIVFVEECAWGFSKERDVTPSAQVVGVTGADFLGDALMAAVDLQMPVGPFMNYHEGHHFNDISDPLHGRARTEEWEMLLEEMRTPYFERAKKVNPFHACTTCGVGVVRGRLYCDEHSPFKPYSPPTT
ncbi:MAG: hypothetical protein GY753_06905 [Gammaproteobacteria bacterium]|nr:hypothetical protein [Gammaproteobacteria bacterium]